MGVQRKSKHRSSSTSRRERHLGAPFDRGLWLEQLEDRRLLAVITVTSLADNLFPDGGVTLREAVQAANTDASVDGSTAGSGADTIEFAAELSGKTITLGGAELEITEAVTIDATALANPVAVDANNASRIFNITAATGDFTFAGLTLTGGRTIGRNANSSDTTFSGGAVRSLTTGNLTIDQSTVSGNSTAGFSAEGGGIDSDGAVTLTSSTVSGNSTTGRFAHGGGIHSSLGTVTLTSSTVSENSTAGSLARGGGISGGTVTLTSSTVSGNSTAGDYTSGGGISGGAVTLTSSTVSGNSTAGGYGSGGGISGGTVTLTSSTVSGNSTAGLFAFGGGIWSFGAVTLTSSTVSGNSTAGDDGSGGGIFSSGAVTLTSSTVSGNSTTGDGGGIWSTNNYVGPPPLISIANSIVAGNTANGGSNDIHPGTGTLNINYSLIGIGVPNASRNNVVSNTPQIGPLASNGGPTKTHALLPGSPAIDAGDPTIQQDLNEFDQRGNPFLRVADGDLPDDIVIDIGAYEAQAPPSADFDQDGNIDGHDFLLWQRDYGTTVGAERSDGNSDDDGDVDSSDLAAWEVTFGEATAPLAASKIGIAPAALPVAAQHVAHSVSEATKLIDLAIVAELARSSTDEQELLVKDQLAVVEGSYDTAFATDYALPLTSNSIEEDFHATSSAEGDDAEGQWLADELVERVFG